MQDKNDGRLIENAIASMKLFIGSLMDVIQPEVMDKFQFDYLGKTLPTSIFDIFALPCFRFTIGGDAIESASVSEKLMIGTSMHEIQLMLVNVEVELLRKFIILLTQAGLVTQASEFFFDPFTNRTSS